MRRASPTSSDLFIPKKGALSRGAGLLTPSPRRPRHRKRSLKAAAGKVEQLLQRHEQKEELIRSTIVNRNFETYFQPIVDLQSRQPVGAEALSRFAHLPVRA